MSWTDWGLVIAGLMIAYGVFGMIWNTWRRKLNSDALIEGAVIASGDPGPALTVEKESRALKPLCSVRSAEVIRTLLLNSDINGEIDRYRDSDVRTAHFRPGKPAAFKSHLDRFQTLAEEEVDKVRVRALDTVVRLYAARLTDAKVAALAAGQVPTWDEHPPLTELGLEQNPQVAFRERLAAYFGEPLMRRRVDVTFLYAAAAVGRAEARFRQEMGLPDRFAD